MVFGKLFRRSCGCDVARRRQQQGRPRVGVDKMREALEKPALVESDFKRSNSDYLYVKNHRNRNWRSAWTPESVSRTAVHKSGITARVGVSPTNPANDIVTLENTTNIDLKRWDLGKNNRTSN